VFVKNITVTIEDSLYRKARVCAAAKNSSLTAIVREFLKEFCQGETEFEKQVRTEKEIIRGLAGGAGRFSASERLSRDEVHQRHAVS
jgi:plasmid stability protein